MATKTETVTCPKCQGRKHLVEFGHVANGVCFCCAGNGTIQVNLIAAQSKLSTDTRKKAEWILASTPESYTTLSYRRLLAIHTFTCGGFGLQEAYPTMRDHFQAVGWDAFCAAQEQHLAK